MVRKLFLIIMFMLAVICCKIAFSIAPPSYNIDRLTLFPQANSNNHSLTNSTYPKNEYIPYPVIITKESPYLKSYLDTIQNELLGLSFSPKETKEMIDAIEFRVRNNGWYINTISRAPILGINGKPLRSELTEKDLIRLGKDIDFVADVPIIVTLLGKVCYLSVSAIPIAPDGNIILVKRAIQPYQGYFTIPGGRVDSISDSFENTLKNKIKGELEEELSIRNIVDSQLTFYEYFLERAIQPNALFIFKITQYQYEQVIINKEWHDNKIKEFNKPEHYYNWLLSKQKKVSWIIIYLAKVKLLAII
ncbi:MAG: hypothetical protein ABII27_04255 [bacterium]